MSSQPTESVLLSLGSNIDPERNLLAATRELADQVEVVAASRVFETVPAGGSRGPTFLNAALKIRYNRDAADLKHGVLRPLEERLGRLRTDDRNAPRTLDLDISLFGQLVVHDLDANLVIPDPEILTRAHVAIPLANLAPATRHPVIGLTLAEIAERLDIRGVQMRAELALWPQSDKFTR